MCLNTYLHIYEVIINIPDDLKSFEVFNEVGTIYVPTTTHATHTSDKLPKAL